MTERATGEDPPLTSEPKRIRVGEIEVEFQEWGAGQRPFVLVHGFTGSRTDWHGVGPILARQRRVVAPDLRGHGGTTNVGRADAYSFDALAQDVLGFLDAMGIGQCDLLGHSMGGAVAMRVALAAPERIASLVLMDTSAGSFRGTPREVYEAGGRVAREHGMERLFELASKMWEDNLPPSVKRLQKTMGIDAYFARVRHNFGAMDPEAFTTLGLALSGQSGLLDRVRDIQCPTLVLVGQEDRSLLDAAQELAAALPDAAHVVIPDAAHSPQLENRDAWLAALDSHFERIGL
jgi:pimeloyl-ACP methyl ester carboxylesterase